MPHFGGDLAIRHLVRGFYTDDADIALGPVFFRSSRSESVMACGRVKWFDRLKGFGFIVPDNGTKEIFVHISALKEVGMTTLVEGQKVEYQVVTFSGAVTKERRS